MCNHLISIVISTYNSKDYISNTLNSVLNQTYKNLEIICVDDCSTDNSISLINKYIEKYTNVILVKHDKNRSLLQTRLSGVKIAKGEYIVFLDGDDSISKNYIADFVNNIDNNKQIIAAGTTHMFKANAEYLYVDNITPKFTLEESFENFDWALLWTMWGKIYPTFMFKNMLSEVGSDVYLNNWEDLYLYTKLMSVNQDRDISIKVIQEYGYLYNRAHEGSLATKVSEQRIKDMFFVLNYILNELDEKIRDDLFKTTLIDHNIPEFYNLIKNNPKKYSNYMNLLRKYETITGKVIIIYSELLYNNNPTFKDLIFTLKRYLFTRHKFLYLILKYPYKLIKAIRRK